MKRETSKKLGRGFFERDAAVVARELIGTIFVRRTGGEELRARVVETEAYLGAHDLACHAAKGRTKRTEIMFGRGGFAYVYFIYGMHAMLNVVTGTEGDAQAVLIRAAEALNFEANLSGPGRLCKGMGITTGDNGVDFCGSEMFFLSGNGSELKILQTPRVGVDYAGVWKDELLRYVDAGSKAVSGPRKLRGVE
jgi:DNA-3-methyladenine glycosylase